LIPTTVVILMLLLALGLPVASVLAILGLTLGDVLAGLPLHRAMGEIAWSANSEVIIVAIPLFVLMGEILLRSGVAARMYDSAVQWMSWLPGGLMHSNIGACTIFAATSGSSAATAATIGTVAIPEMRKHGYHEGLFLGTLAAGGTLGILIPPSINLIVYGVLTETSIPKLYLAGFIPGFLLAALFMVTVLIACLVRPRWGGRPVETSWRARVESLPALLPPLGLFLVVIGSIYAGIATPTESASLGVICSLGLAAAHRRLDWPVLRAAIEGTMRTTAMILLIFVAAFFLNFVIAAVGLTHEINGLILGLGLSPLETLLAVVVFYLVLGCFMETMAMMITTIPIVAPVITAMGYDPIWFGIIVILLVETAMITPPVGVNLYIVHGIRREGALQDIMLGAAPFVLALLAMVGILVAFPELALWLPDLWEQYR
jgi:tripartite ATP-independent transporter DctM subunit